MNYLNYIKNNDISDYHKLREHFMSNPLSFNVYDTDNLAIIIYNNSINYPDELQPLVNECNGLIIDKYNINNIICYGLDKCKEIYLKYNDTNTNINFKYEINDDLKDTEIYDLIDGTVMKVYFHDNKWFHSTTRMIKSSNSFWKSKKSFKQLFDETATNLDYSKLDKQNTYVFLICHPENRNIIDYKQSKIYHIFTRNNQTFEKINDNINIEKPKKLSFDSKKQLENYLLSNNSNNGVIIFNHLNQRIKIHSKKYSFIKSLVNNERNPYIVAINNIKNFTENELIKNYPEYSIYVDIVKKRLFTLVKWIHNEYVSRFIQKKFFQKPLFLKTLNELHNNYKKTKQINNFHKVYDHIFNYHPKRILYMITHYNLNNIF